MAVMGSGLSVSGVSELLFLLVVALVLIERLLETRINQRNLAKLLARGGRVHAPGPVGAAMGLLHGSWFVAMLLEVFGLNRPFYPWEAALSLLALVAGMSLRAASMRALGERWTIQITTLPGAPLVEGGVYRSLRHPNYLGVILEMFALPLLHHAWLTAIVYGLLNLIFLLAKIRLEERALAQDSGRADFFSRCARLIPGLF
jgi:methyltransferase